MNTHKYRAIGTICLCLGLLAMNSCSSLPRKVPDVNERKNEAAGYLRLADGFFSKSQYASALQYYTEALGSNLAVDYREGAITARSSLGRVYMRLEAWSDASREMQDALFDATLLGDKALLALCLNNLGELAYVQKDYPQADDYFSQAAASAGNNEKLMAIIDHNRGVAALNRGELAEARAFFDKARSANEKASRWSEYAANCYMLASVENRADQVANAISWAEKALEADKKAENSVGIGADLEALGRLQRKSGNYLAAFDYFRRSFNLSLQLNNVGLASRSLEQLVSLAEILELPEAKDRYLELQSRLR